MKVKDTKLSLIRAGDVILYKQKGLMNGDFLGFLIATFEGGQGNYTHVASIRDVPDPDADVIEVKPGVFKVVEKKWIETITRETPFEGEAQTGQILRNSMGVKLEATWPKCREWGIAEWDSEFIEVWRIRNLTDQNISDILRMQQDMVGFESFDAQGNHPDAWDYNLAEFITFGLLNQAAAKVCSQFEADTVYDATLLRGCENGNYPIPLTPDLRGNRDPEKTPNEFAMSGFAYRIAIQGLLTE